MSRLQLAVKSSLLAICITMLSISGKCGYFIRLNTNPTVLVNVSFPGTPVGIAMDASGHIIVITSEGNVISFTVTGSILSNVALPMGSGTPKSITMDDVGDIYILTSNGTIMQLNTGLSVLHMQTVPGTPVDVATDGTSVFIVTTTRIYKKTAILGALNDVAIAGTPTSVAAIDGEIYVTTSSNTVLRLSVALSTLSTGTVPGTPIDIAGDSAGDIIVATSGGVLHSITNTINILHSITLSGTLLGVDLNDAGDVISANASGSVFVANTGLSFQTSIATGSTLRAVATNLVGDIIAVGGTGGGGMATIGITDASPFNFGTQPNSGPAVNHTFNITKSGAPTVNISSITSSNSHFTVSSVPATAPGSFVVSFDPGTTSGSFNATITITATAGGGGTVNSPFTFIVQGTTAPPIPDAQCVGGDCSAVYATADYTIGESKDFTKKVHNGGTATLHINSITLSGSSEFVILSGGGAGDVIPNTDRTVTIRYTPINGEHMSCGGLVISSNDPDHSTLNCPFGARAHHPVPIMVVESNDLNYRDVELGFSFAKPLIIRNDGDANLVLSVTIVDNADPDIPQWSSLETPSSSTVLPMQSLTLKEIFSPASLGNYSIQLSVAGNDLLNPSQAIILHGNGTAPIPMDNVLVLDRSGSMDESAGTQRKIEALQKAANLYVDLLRPEAGSGTGDKIGLVKYNDANSEHLSFDFKTAAHYADAQTALNDAAISDISKLKPDNATGIGGAMKRAADMLVSSPDTRKQVMVVMTDGKENRDPRVHDVLNDIVSANPDLMIYSLGLGNDFDGSVLQSITTVGNGYHQVSADLLGNNIFALEEFYFKIYSNATGADLIVDPTRAVDLSTGAITVVYSAHVVSSDRYATFLVLDDPALRAFYKLELISPTGQVMDPGSSVAGIPIQVMRRMNYTIYKVIFPDISQSASYIGDWKVILTPTKKWNPKDAKKASERYTQAQGEYIQPYLGLVPVGFGAAVKSDYHMEVAVTANSYQPGANVLLTAKLTDRGWPSSGTVNLTATRPNNAVSNFVLYDDGTHGDINSGDGIYSNTYNQTALNGSYKFYFKGIGINERGELVPREATRYVSLSTPPKTDGGEGDHCKSCLPCWVKWLMLILLLFILILIIRYIRR